MPWSSAAAWPKFVNTAPDERYRYWIDVLTIAAIMAALAVGAATHEGPRSERTRVAFQPRAR